MNLIFSNPSFTIVNRAEEVLVPKEKCIHASLEILIYSVVIDILNLI